MGAAVAILYRDLKVANAERLRQAEEHERVLQELYRALKRKGGSGP